MRLSSTLAPAALAIAGAGMLLSSGALNDKPGPGDVAPEIDGTRWFNNLGAPPSMASLKGRAVLLEFWATW